MKRTYSARQWAEWIEQQKKSGLSVAAFCERIGVSQRMRTVIDRPVGRIQERSGADPAAARPRGSGNDSGAAQAVWSVCG